MADPTMLREIVDSVKSLGRKVMVAQFPISKKASFDGSNADAFCKWLLDMEDIYTSVDKDDQQTLWAASQLLKGSALNYFRDHKKDLDTWEKLKEGLQGRYNHFNTVSYSKQKLRNVVQNKNESVADYAERVRVLSGQAYPDRIAEKEVTETIVNAFINGLRERRLQERIARQMPPDLNTAYHLAMNELRLKEHLSMFRDNTSAPEPMDCDMITRDDAMQKKLDAVTETLANICQVLTTQQQQPPPPPPQPRQPQQLPPHQRHFQVQPQFNQQYQQHMNRPPPQQFQRPPQQFQRNRQNFQQNYQPQRRTMSDQNNPQDYRWTADNRPICHYCGFIGHTQRVCRKKAAALNLPPPPPQQQSKGN